ncbi:MAG: T9SS type A sorting domain-containing protein [Bacteroidota bacterium]
MRIQMEGCFLQIQKIQKILLLTIVLFISNCVFSQQPGYIVRPAGGPGASALNPNQDAYTSATTAGFTTSDITQSEIAYVKIPQLQTEPTGDLATGPTGGYSDIIGVVDGSGCYIYYNSASGYVQFRFRIGGIVNGAKAYNVLIDSDMKMGASGASADPNYIGAANAGNGNPGFEIEIAFVTGSSSAVKIFDVDGRASGSGSLPVEKNSYDASTNAIVSVALSRESGNADYFYDFFVPYSALSTLGLSNTTAFRIVTTTNTNPGSAFQGTRSDIMGINDANYSNTTDAWEYVAKNTPSVTLNSVTSGGAGFSSGSCTAAPTVSTDLAYGASVTVTGSWAKLTESSVTTATITVYKNGTSIGTTTCTSGNTWSLAGQTLAQGDVITAKAQGSGESMCLTSNSVKVQSSCITSNTTTTTDLAFTCVTIKGLKGTMPSGSSVKLYTIDNDGSKTLFADDATTTLKITYAGSSSTTGTVWEYQGSSNGGTSDPCGGGSNDIDKMSFAATATISPNCESPLVFSSICNANGTTSAPTITQAVLYATSTTVSGTSTTGYRVFLIINGNIISTTVAASNAYSFTGLVLSVGDIIEVRAKAPNTGSGGSTNIYCVSSAASITVKCFTSAPTITTDLNGNLAQGATTVSGNSSESSGTTIKVYQSPSTLLGTTTVQANGTWSVSVSALSSGVSIFATAQNGTCSVSDNSSTASTLSETTICATFTGSYTESSTSVSGTLTSTFSGTVYLYQDGAQVGSTSVSSSTSWSITGIASGTLYAGGVLTLGTQETGKTLKTNCGNTTTVTCTLPTAPSISPTTASLTSLNQTVTFTISNSVSGVLYSILDQTSGTSYAPSQFGNGSNLTMTTTAGSFNTANTTYNLYVQADKLSGSSCKSNTSVTITTNSLPVTWISVIAQKQGGDALLRWVTGTEQNTKDFEIQHSANTSNWQSIGTVAAAGNSTTQREYSFVHTTPLKNNNYNYYRILQRDLDDKFSYSKVVSIIFNEPGADLQVYPNPAEDVVTVFISEEQEVSLLNAAGALVWKSKLPAGRSQLPLEKFSSGLYFLRTKAQTIKLLIK